MFPDLYTTSLCSQEFTFTKQQIQYYGMVWPIIVQVEALQHIRSPLVKKQWKFLPYILDHLHNLHSEFKKEL